jgi:superfamily I DNA/RNA helicase
LVARLGAALASGQVPDGQYGAVLVDEGHDFEGEWLKIVVKMVDPETNSLLVLYDDAQSIYKRRGAFSFRSVGINAQGRTTILRLNYRNTAEVLRIAHKFAEDVLKPEDADEDGVPLIQPHAAGRHGPEPRLLRFATCVTKLPISPKFSPSCTKTVTTAQTWLSSTGSSSSRRRSAHY